MTFPTMKEVTVVDGTDETGSYLCAYFVSEEEPIVAELREHLAKTLPYYMIPAHFVKLDQWPLTPNGKLDRKALPKPDGNLRTRHEQVLPRNAIEAKIAQLWSVVLKKEIDRIGVYDSFFDLGGNSLSLLKLNQLLNTEFAREFVVTDLFRYNTIEELAATFECDKEDDDTVKIAF
jgi:acyl carrier protein